MLLEESYYYSCDYAYYRTYYYAYYYDICGNSYRITHGALRAADCPSVRRGHQRVLAKRLLFHNRQNMVIIIGTINIIWS